MKKIEVGPPAARRHLGKQKPVVIDDSKRGSSRKKVVVSFPGNRKKVKDEFDTIAREMNLQPDEPQVIESKSSAPARAHIQQASEGQVEKLGNEAVEPRRVSVPLPGSEVQAMTPAYRKMLRKKKTVLNCTNLTCKASVVHVVLQLHHRLEPGLQAYELPTLEMSSLLTMLRSC